MGMSLYRASSSTYDGPAARTSPRPDRFTILREQTLGKWLVVLAEYDDATNYEGRKIMVYRGVSLAALRQWRSIDPHFSHEAPELSPIARFVPSDEGWRMAVAFVEMMSLSGK